MAQAETVARSASGCSGVSPGRGQLDLRLLAALSWFVDRVHEAAGAAARPHIG